MCIFFHSERNSVMYRYWLIKNHFLVPWMSSAKSCFFPSSYPTPACGPPRKEDVKHFTYLAPYYLYINQELFSFWTLFCFFFFSLRFIFLLNFFFLFVVNFVIHWNETSLSLHVFPIPIPPPTSLSKACYNSSLEVHIYFCNFTQGQTAFVLFINCF